MESLLKPMRADALMCRPAAQAAPGGRAVLVRMRQEECGPAPQETPMLFPCPASLAPPAACAASQPPPPCGDAPALPADDDEPAEDFTPTSCMPVPVCVPLWAEEPPSKRMPWWLLPLLALLLLSAYVLWRLAQP